MWQCASIIALARLVGPRFNWCGVHVGRRLILLPPGVLTEQEALEKLETLKASGLRLHRTTRSDGDEQLFTRRAWESCRSDGDEQLFVGFCGILYFGMQWVSFCDGGLSACIRRGNSCARADAVVFVEKVLCAL